MQTASPLDSASAEASGSQRGQLEWAGGDPGHPSTHPAEGSDQGQQSSCDAVLIQGGAVLQQARGVGTLPSAPPLAPPTRAAPPAVPQLSAPVPRAARRVRAADLCAWTLLGHPHRQTRVSQLSHCQKRHPHGLAGEALPTPTLRHLLANSARPGLTCRQQFIMRTTKSNCWWSRTARFCCTCRCSSWARQRRAARPFRALSTAGSSCGQNHRNEGSSLRRLQLCPEGLEGGTGKARPRGGGWNAGSPLRGGWKPFRSGLHQTQCFTAQERLTLQCSQPCPHAAHGMASVPRCSEGGGPVAGQALCPDTAGSEGLHSDFCYYHSL